MRKLVSAICIVSILFLLNAQNRLNIHFKDYSIKRFALSQVDSLNFKGTDSICIKTFNRDSVNYAINLIDSISFSDTIAGYPVVQTIAVDKIVQESARSGLKFISAGESAVTSRGICWSTHPQPTIADSKYASPLTSSTQALYVSGLTGSTQYYVRAYATNAKGTGYGDEYRFTTTDYTLPVVETTSVDNAGGLEANCTGTVSNTGGYTKFISRGFCWSTKPEPTINDSVAPMPTALIGSYTRKITFPAIGVTYYVRSYATNGVGTTYGTVKSIKPTMGNLTYTLDPSSLPVGSANYKLIKIAMDSAMYYYNKYATFSGNIWVYYNSGIPTAQASNRGSIGFGSNTSYMHVCTAMHETAHWLGSGTTTSWQNLTVNGVYTGAAATAMLKSVTNNPSAVLSGDDMHFWPYGLNYRSEVTSANDYIFHAKIVNAMKTDCGW